MCNSGLYLLTLTLIFCSCSKGDDHPTPPDPEPVDSMEEKYEIVELTFYGEEATEEEIIEYKPNLTYRNNTSSIQNIIVDPKPIYERSKFVPDDYKSYKLLDSAKKMSIPIEIKGSEVSLGEEKWIYSTRESLLPTKLTFKESLEVEPRKILSASLSMVYTKITAPYILKIKNIDTDELVNIKGEWYGIYPDKTEISSDIHDL